MSDPRSRNSQPLPYGRQAVDEDDVAAVLEVLRSDWLTTGPHVEQFEAAMAHQAGVDHAVALSNGTAALHAIMHGLQIGPGDEVLVPAMTFAASANSVVYCGGTPRFVDVDPETLLIDPQAAAAAVNSRTRAILAVDYAGQPCDYDHLHALARRHDLALVADACHSWGATYQSRPVGSLALASAFSFHPVKPLTTGEGGMVITDNEQLAEDIRVFRNHGIATDHRQRESAGTWYYEMRELGYNYRLSDIQCALGISQMKKVPMWTRRRQEIADEYDRAFADWAAIQPLTVRPPATSSYHLYVVRWKSQLAGVDRGELFNLLRASGIGVNVHYLPVHLHPFYRDRYGTQPGQCPVAESAYEEIISLPIFPAMTVDDVRRVVDSVTTAVAATRRRAS